AAAAYAAADGLGCIVLSGASLPSALAHQISAYGAVIGVLEPGRRAAILAQLVREGWHPSTSSDPKLSGAATPFGVDGYKAIALEIVEQLGRVPDLVTVPAASGDLFVGVARGFSELARRGRRAPV